jgi:hypothetical protein
VEPAQSAGAKTRSKPDGSAPEKNTDLLIGALAGAATGAVIGGLFGGGIGALVGGVIGALAGGIAGGLIGSSSSSAPASGSAASPAQPSSATTPATATPATAPLAAAPITPNFILDKSEAPRSNTKPSTQSAAAPTFLGASVADSAASKWRYELRSVESRGKIRIVYFTPDHYPAPTPNDDSGALTNVNTTNWSAIVDDLERNKAGIPDFWSAYRAEDVHETYHWEVEWQGEMKKELVKAQADIAKLEIGFDKAATTTDADRILEPQAATIFNAAMRRARASYDALPDSPGAPAYQAQIPVVTTLINRVKAFAQARKWVQ